MDKLPQIIGPALARGFGAGVFAAAALASAAGAAGPEPLTAADLALYLKTMHAAAARARHPTAEDRALAERAEQVQAHQRTEYKAFEARHSDGSKASAEEIARLNASNPAGADLEAIRHTAALHSRADSVIVEEQKVDPRYWAVKQAVERTLSWMEAAEAHPGSVAPKPDFKALPPDLAVERKRVWDIDQGNLALLRPHEHEIEKLVDAVNPGHRADDD